MTVPATLYVRMAERITNKDYVRTALVVSKRISSLWKTKHNIFNPQTARTYQLVLGSIVRRASHPVFLGSIRVDPPCSSHVDASKHHRKCYQLRGCSRAGTAHASRSIWIKNMSCLVTTDAPTASATAVTDVDSTADVIPVSAPSATLATVISTAYFRDAPSYCF